MGTVYVLSKNEELNKEISVLGEINDDDYKGILEKIDERDKRSDMKYLLRT